MAEPTGLAPEHRRTLDLLKRVKGVGSMCDVADNVQVVNQTDVAVHLLVGDVPVDVVRYPYSPIHPPQPGPDDFPVAGIADLAAMKLAAIVRRGIRRDFWDLYAICQGGMSLQAASDAYATRFGKKQPDLYHVWRSITYFEDAEDDPTLPLGLTEAKWESMKAFFRQEAKRSLLELSHEATTSEP